MADSGEKIACCCCAAITVLAVVGEVGVLTVVVVVMMGEVLLAIEDCWNEDGICDE